MPLHDVKSMQPCRWKLSYYHLSKKLPTALIMSAILCNDTWQGAGDEAALSSKAASAEPQGVSAAADPAVGTCSTAPKPDNPDTSGTTLCCTVSRSLTSDAAQKNLLVSLRVLVLQLIMRANPAESLRQRLLHAHEHGGADLYASASPCIYC